MPIVVAAAGAFDDYARGGGGIKNAVTVKLSPIDESLYVTMFDKITKSCADFLYDLFMLYAYCRCGCRSQ